MEGEGENPQITSLTSLEGVKSLESLINPSDVSPQLTSLERRWNVAEGRGGGLKRRGRAP